MIEREIVVTVAGHPKPKGSLKCIGARGPRGHVLIEDNKGTKPWRTTLVGWFRQAPRRADDGQPIAVVMTSTLKRPEAHRGSGRNAGVIKDWALRLWPVGHSTGDVDKLARLVLDAMQDAKVLPDDCQVVDLRSRKTYVESGTTDALDYPGVLVRIYPVPEVGPADPVLPVEERVSTHLRNQILAAVDHSVAGHSGPLAVANAITDAVVSTIEAHEGCTHCAGVAE